MSRTWLLTSTTYGTWLPVDERGFVSTVRDEPGPRKRHNLPETPYDRDVPGLSRSARRLLRAEAVRLTGEQALTALAQFRETARQRSWNMLAASVMANHFHLVVEAAEATQSTVLLRDFKAYASRALHSRWPKPASGTWWTESGSRRPLPNEPSVEAAVEYVRQQPGALAVWWVGDEQTRGASASGG